MASICALIVSEWSIPTTDDTSSNVVDSNFSAASIWYCSWLYLSALKKSASSNDLLAATFGSDPLDDFALDPINLVQIHSKRGKYAANYFAFIKGCVDAAHEESVILSWAICPSIRLHDLLMSFSLYSSLSTSKAHSCELYLICTATA